MGSGKLLKMAIKKYGLENFSKEILFVFSSEEEMNAKEKELVIVSEETYNLCEGGRGGFGYINENKLGIPYFKIGMDYSIINKKSMETKQNLKNNEFWYNSYKNTLSNSLKGNKSFLNKTHSQKTKNLMSSIAKERLKDPTKNSQYGTCWITNGQENKKIKKEDVDKWIELGYSKGRKIIQAK